MAEIRLARIEDATQIAEIYAPFVASAATSFELEVPSSSEMARRINATLETHPWLVSASGDQILGYAYACQHRTRAGYRWSVDVAVYVSPAHRKKGVGRALYYELFWILRLQGFFNAYAGIALPNPASVALHEAVGFVPVGTYKQVGYKLGAWHDVGWWQMSLCEDRNDEPAEPKPLHQLIEGGLADEL